MEPCPSCHQIDQVQKVSAIVSGGTIQGISSTGASVYTASTLAQRLSLPTAPSVVRTGGCSTILLILSGGLGIILLGIASSTSRGVPYYQSNWNIAIGVLVFAAIVLIYRLAVTRSGAQDEKALAKWSQMRARWDKLYYCHRCDVIYIKDEQKYASSANMFSLLG